MYTTEQKLIRAEQSKNRYHNNKEYREKKKLKMKEWALNNPEKVKSYSYKREGTTERLKQKAEAQSRYRYRNKMKLLGVYKNFRGDRTKQASNWRSKPENKIKKSAHMKVYLRIKNGTILKQPCEICNKLPAMAHHDDYSKPLDIRWLCAQHHYEHHQSLLH